jgi:hypothetical protein
MYHEAALVVADRHAGRRGRRAREADLLGIVLEALDLGRAKWKRPVFRAQVVGLTGRNR